MDKMEIAGPILLVEDEQQLRKTVQWVLEDEGLDVETATNGVDALDMARRRRPALVVLDMALPLLNGDGVAAGLKEEYGTGIPILAMTADGRAAAKARRVGAFDYLQKPFDISDLLSAVQKGLAS